MHDAVYRELGRDSVCRCCWAAITASASAPSARSHVIAARQGKDLRVLWLDAHADFNTRDLSPSGNLHGMPVACLCGFGPRELMQTRRYDAGHQPAMDPAGRHPQRRHRREALRARAGAGSVRHALHR